MVDQQIITEWIATGDEDYYFVRQHLPHEESFFAIYCFHCQQAAEKYFKAAIIKFELPLRKIHNLIELLDVCVRIDSAFEMLRLDAKLLERYYVDTRYPAVWPVGYIRNDAEEVFVAVGKIREFILPRIQLHKKTI